MVGALGLYADEAFLFFHFFSLGDAIRIQTYFSPRLLLQTFLQDQKCHFKRSGVGADDTGFVDLPSKSEEHLQEAVANIGPISVAIDASQPSFQSYNSGKSSPE